MKRSLFFMTAFCLSLMNFTAHAHTKFTLLEDKAIHWVDGIQGLLDAEAIRDSLDVRRIINNIVYGTKNHATGLFEKHYDLAGWPEKVCLTDLVKFSITYNQAGIPADDIRWQDLNFCLNTMKKEFKGLTQPLLESAAEAITVNMRLIKEWTSKTNRSNSMLLLWGTIDEEKALWEATPAELRQFLLDLQNFLKDLMYSCPKARRKYNEKYIKDTHKQEEFEAIFKQR